MPFSEETKLLLTNWEAYQDVLEADRRLRTETQKELLGLEPLLRRQEWWSKAWSFKQKGTGQVYIAHDQWVADGEALVWVGVEGFTPEAVFGNAAPAHCYVWVSKSQATTLIAQLRAVFKPLSAERDGQVESGRTNAYIVRATVPTCLPQQLHEFETRVMSELVSFFSHCAVYQAKVAEAVAEYLSEKK